MDARGANLNTEQLHDEGAAHFQYLFDALAAKLVGNKRGARLRDRAAATAEGNVGDDPRVIELQLQIDDIAAVWVAPF